MTPRPDDDEHDCGWKRYAAAQDEKLAEVAEKFVAMEAKLAAMERTLFGKKSEKRPKPVKLPPPAPEIRSPKDVQKLRKSQRAVRDAALETETIVVPVPDAERVCPSCNDADSLRPAGSKSSVIIDFVHAHFRKRVFRRETLACTCGGIITAAPPDRFGDKTHYATGFCAHIIVSKMRDHIPLYRMAKAFTSQGIPVARSTLNALLHRSAKELLPIYNAAAPLVAAAHRVHADETSFRQQTSTAKTYLWAFVTDDVVFYHYADSRSGDTPKKILGNSPGLLTVDQHSGYNAVAMPGRRIRGGCLAHARRKVFEARALPETAEALELIRQMYLLERRAKKAGILHTPAHLRIRKREARPLFAKLLLWARHHRRRAEPRSLLGKATGYLVRNFRDLGRFLRHAELRLDNNRAESAMRPVALGRKNFLFVGTAEAGKHLAALYTLVATCELHRINPLEYLTDVLMRVQTHPAARVAELLPHRWKPLDR